MIFAVGESLQAADVCNRSFYTSLKFPLLETFPRTLFARVASQRQGLDVQGALTTSSNTKSRLKDVQQLIGRALKPEERELLFSDLNELGEAYTHGWSDSDSGEDD
jgi:hypothetical protein